MATLTLRLAAGAAARPTPARRGGSGDSEPEHPTLGLTARLSPPLRRGPGARGGAGSAARPTGTGHRGRVMTSTCCSDSATDSESAP